MRLARVSWGLLAALLPLAAAAQEAAEAAAAGRRLYVMSCQRCHGIELATNGIGFDLRTFPRDDKERFVRSVLNGKNGMPAWNGVLKPAQLDLIWAYIGSVNGWPAAPAVAASAP